MPIIRPVSDLKDKFDKISDICHQEGEPVFLTVQGAGDMVIMSLAFFEQQQARLELYKKLAEAEFEAHVESVTITHGSVMRRLRDRLDG